MLSILKKQKEEKVSLDLQNPANRRVAAQASLNYRVPLLSKGDGIFFLDLKHTKDENLTKFFRYFVSKSVGRIQAVIDRDDPKCDYIVIFDIKEE